jgi:hypothetical protein
MYVVHLFSVVFFLELDICGQTDMTSCILDKEPIKTENIISHKVQNSRNTFMHIFNLL